MKIRKVLVATDFSEQADRAIDAAVEIARLSGASIDLVHAFDMPSPLVSPYEVAVPPDFLGAARDEAKRRLTASEEAIRDRGVEVRAHLSDLPAGAAIAEAAEQLESDLVVLGTQGHTGLKHLVLGSVAERTVRTAPCSVLTIK